MDPTKYLPEDPNKPVTLDLARCRTLVRTAPAYYGFPGGGRLKDVVDQLALLMREHSDGAQKVATAQSEAVRFQRELQAANLEVGKVSGELLEERRRTSALTAEVERLKGEFQKLAPKPEIARDTAPAPEATKKRGRRGKVVEMPKEAAQ